MRARGLSRFLGVLSVIFEFRDDETGIPVHVLAKFASPIPERA